MYVVRSGRKGLALGAGLSPAGGRALPPRSSDPEARHLCCPSELRVPRLALAVSELAKQEEGPAHRRVGSQGGWKGGDGTGRDGGIVTASCFLPCDAMGQAEMPQVPARQGRAPALTTLVLALCWGTGGLGARRARGLSRWHRRRQRVTARMAQPPRQSLSTEEPQRCPSSAEGRPWGPLGPGAQAMAQGSREAAWGPSSYGAPSTGPGAPWGPCLSPIPAVPWRGLDPWAAGNNLSPELDSPVLGTPWAAGLMPPPPPRWPVDGTGAQAD